MNNTQLETKLRNRFLELVNSNLTNEGEQVLQVSNNELALPCLDEEQNERWIVIRISTPRGTRDGKGGYIPYDGYKLAEDYQQDLEEAKAAKAKKKAKGE